MKALYSNLLLTLILPVAAQAITPVSDPQNKNTVNVFNTSQLNAALSNASAGDVILLQTGVYNGPFAISKSGTASSPIIIRGVSQAAILDRARTEWGNYSSATRDLYKCWDKGNEVLYINGSHVYVENLTVQGGTWGIKFGKSASHQGNVVRNTRIKDSYCGISFWESNYKDFYICDNRMEGRLPINARVTDPVTNYSGRLGWAIDGIKFVGKNHIICHNTLSGYGDTIDNPPSYDTDNVEVFGNDILWGGDDGIELDGKIDTVRAHHNRISNSGTGISVQANHSSGGTYDIYRNIIYNSGLTYYEGSNLLLVPKPFKFDSSSIYFYHNTSVRVGFWWDATGQGGIVENKNNLVLGSTSSLKGIINDSQTINLSLPIFDPIAQILRRPDSAWSELHAAEPLTLNASSAAVDAGVRIVGYNDDYTGSAPDLGALERGKPLPIYGVRGQGQVDTLAPMSPTNLEVQ